MDSDKEKRARVRAMNDALRCHGLGGQTLVTPGIAALGWDQLLRVLQAVRRFSDFEAGNDPYEEHDFGSLEVEGARIFWKIDYYDLKLEYGSEDPADPTRTERVLTIMLAAEY